VLAIALPDDNVNGPKPCCPAAVIATSETLPVGVPDDEVTVTGMLKA
jgi:hypothetical protein